MDLTKPKENREFLPRTKPNLGIKNTHFDCIFKGLFFIDLHHNLPPFRTDLFPFLITRIFLNNCRCPSNSRTLVAVSPNCIWMNVLFSGCVRFGCGQRITNPRYGRIQFCATSVAAVPRCVF